VAGTARLSQRWSHFTAPSVRCSFVARLKLKWRSHNVPALWQPLLEARYGEGPARSVAMSDEPDIVLMDVNLEGGREGIEAARWLRQVCGTDVVFVTSYTDEDTVERI
jgi:CheY-like chemotaxis protein